MTNPSHQPVAANTPARNSPTIGPAETEFTDRNAQDYTDGTAGRDHGALTRRTDQIGGGYCEVPTDEVKRNDSLERQGQEGGGRNCVHPEERSDKYDEQ